MGLVTALIGSALFSISGLNTTASVPQHTTLHSLPVRAPLLADAPVTPTPTAPPASAVYDRYLTFDFLPEEQVYNELSPGNVGHKSNQEHAAIEFSLLHVHLVALGGFDLFDYPHFQDSSTPVNCDTHPNEQGCVEVIGDGGRVFLPAFTANEFQLEAGLGVQVAPDHWYVTADYLYSSTNFGDPDLLGGGFGIQKLPDFNRRFSLYGRINYYPEIANPHVLGDIAGHALSYRYLKYEVGGAWKLPAGFFANLVYGCDDHFDRTNAPAGATLCGPEIGVGLHL